jgi:hypothetical protein
MTMISRSARITASAVPCAPLSPVRLLIGSRCSTSSAPPVALDTPRT